MTTEDIQERLQDLQALHRDGSLTPQALTIQLYGLYVEAVQQIAAGDVDDPHQLCDALLREVAHQFQDRPWVPLAIRR